MKQETELIELHIFRIDGDSLEFLLLKRSSEQYYPGLWQMVNGKIKKEIAYTAEQRERILSLLAILIACLVCILAYCRIRRISGC